MLKVEKLHSGYYTDINVLSEVSLEVKKGNVTTVLGPNGSGKSTLLKTVYGYLKPFSGNVIFRGEDITGKEPHSMIERGIAYISQEHGIFPHLTVEENLKTGLWVMRKDKQEIWKRIKTIYEKFPVLEERKNMKAGFLSGGQQKLLQFSIALLTNPVLLLIDEPTAGLSPILSEDIYQLINSIKKEGKTILLVEQNIRKALEISDYVYVLELGKIRYEGGRDDFEKGLKEILTLWGFEH
jgi:branched-chain amino acid transport system ATP-binding protein